jgi:type VI secretion system FHA domain protein
MTLYLRLIEHPFGRVFLDGTIEKSLEEHGGSIGRAEHCDFVLQDETKSISKIHALIHFRDGIYYLTDVSTNGVSVNNDTIPIGKGNTKQIIEGDSFRIGPYVLQASMHKKTATSAEIYSLPKNKMADTVEDELEKLLSDHNDSGLNEFLIEDNHSYHANSYKNEAVGQERSIDELLSDFAEDDSFDLHGLVPVNNLSVQRSYNPPPMPSNIHSFSGKTVPVTSSQDSLRIARFVFDEIAKEITIDNFEAMFPALNKATQKWFGKNSENYNQENLELFFKKFLERKATIIGSALDKIKK